MVYPQIVPLKLTKHHTGKFIYNRFFDWQLQQL